MLYFIIIILPTNVYAVQVTKSQITQVWGARMLNQIWRPRVATLNNIYIQVSILNTLIFAN